MQPEQFSAAPLITGSSVKLIPFQHTVQRMSRPAAELKTTRGAALPSPRLPAVVTVVLVRGGVVTADVGANSSAERWLPTAKVHP
jgi:hypothetical protein